MTRGNQREKAREKNLKKQQEQKKKQEGDPRKRMEAHAAIMREKQKAGKFVWLIQGCEAFGMHGDTDTNVALEKKAAEGKTKG